MKTLFLRIYSSRQVSRSLWQQCLKNSTTTLLYILLSSPFAYSVLIKYLVKAKEDEALLHRQQSDNLSPAFIIGLLEVFLKCVGLNCSNAGHILQAYILDSLTHEGKSFTKTGSLGQGVPRSGPQGKDGIAYRFSDTWLTHERRLKNNTPGYDLSRTGQDAIFRGRTSIYFLIFHELFLLLSERRKLISVFLFFKPFHNFLRSFLEKKRKKKTDFVVKSVVKCWDINDTIIFQLKHWRGRGRKVVFTQQKHAKQVLWIACNYLITTCLRLHMSVLLGWGFWLLAGFLVGIFFWFGLFGWFFSGFFFKQRAGFLLDVEGWCDVRERKHHSTQWWKKGCRKSMTTLYNWPSLSLRGR